MSGFGSGAQWMLQLASCSQFVMETVNCEVHMVCVALVSDKCNRKRNDIVYMDV